jgi:uncharacterized membrane protein YphA (DoxX/SURF4 family)
MILDKESSMTSEQNTRFRQRIPILPKWMRWPIIICRIVMGSIFIVSGLMKTLDAQSFLATLPYYHLPEWLIPLGALIPAVEVTIGFAFIVGLVLPFATLAAAGLLVTFSVLLLVGIAGGELETCGCFGRLLEQSPGSALFRNLILLILTAVIWLYYRKTVRSWPIWKVGPTIVILLVAGTITGYTVHAPQIDDSRARIGDFFPTEDILANEIPDLTGEHFLFVFSVNCEHCWNVVENVKTIAADSNYSVIGIAGSSPSNIAWFREEFDAQFPIYSYDVEAFQEAFRAWPSLYYVQDGLILGRIEQEVPVRITLEEVHLPNWR